MLADIGAKGGCCPHPWLAMLEELVFAGREGESDERKSGRVEVVMRRYANNEAIAVAGAVYSHRYITMVRSILT